MIYLCKKKLLITRCRCDFNLKHGFNNHKASDCHCDRPSLKCKSCGKTGHVKKYVGILYLISIVPAKSKLYTSTYLGTNNVNNIE